MVEQEREGPSPRPLWPVSIHLKHLISIMLTTCCRWDGLYMFHCHNLIHEDHDMMAALNVTALKDLGYDEKTTFIDPMDPKYRAKSFNSDDYPNRKGDFESEAIAKKCRDFQDMDAYKKVGEVEQKLEEYWKTHSSQTTLVTKTSSGGGSGTSASTTGSDSASSGASGSSSSAASPAVTNSSTKVSSAGGSTLITSTSSAKSTSTKDDDKGGKSKTSTKK